MSKIKVNSIEAATGSTITIPSGQTLDISSTTLTLPSTVVTTTGTQTLTNKTIGVSQLTGTLPVANGGTGLTSLGSASQVLRVNSGATALEFATASSDFVKLAETTASNVSSVSLNGYFTTDYDIYKIYVDGIYASADGYAGITFNTTGSYTQQTSSYDYVMGAYRDVNTDAEGASYDNGDNQAYIRFLQSGTSITTGGSVEFVLFNPMSTTQYKMVAGSAVFRNASYISGTGFCGSWNTTTAITGINFKMTSGGGNLYARKIRLYGIKN